MLVVRPDRDEKLVLAVSLTKGTPHSCLEPISSSTRQHFSDPENMERVDPHPDVKLVLAAVLHQVLVAANPSSLKSLRGKLLQLIRNQVNRKGELVHKGLLPTQVEDPDLGVRHTPVEPALGVGLVLAIAVALGRPPTHFLLL